MNNSGIILILKGYHLFLGTYYGPDAFSAIEHDG
jgi:hypothetical protein